MVPRSVDWTEESSSRKRSTQEQACLDPVPLHGSPGDFQCLRDLVVGHSAEESTIHDASQSRFGKREPFDRVVQLEHRFGLIVGWNQLAIERHLLPVTVPFLGKAGTGAVYEDVTHDDRRKRYEVCPITPHRALLVRQLQVRFVDQPGGRERVAGPAGGELASGYLAQLVVHGGHDTIEARPAVGPRLVRWAGLRCRQPRGHEPRTCRG